MISKFVSVHVLWVLIPIYTWIKFYKKVKLLKCQWKADRTFYNAHNCVVMYRNGKLPTGWPSWANMESLICKNVFLLFEPIIYFINTATKSIDVAVMMITSDLIISALCEAHERNVKVRLLIDFNATISGSCKKLSDKGIEVQSYVCPTLNHQSIFHHKYAIKDYANNNGYILSGSLNWTATGIFNNYESIFFSSNPNVVNIYHENFNALWKWVSENQSSVTREIIKNTVH